jgi:cell division protein FtsB
MRTGNSQLSRKILGSPFTLFAALVVFVLLAKAAWNIHQKAILSETKLSQAQAELKKLQDHQTDINRQIGYLSTDEGIVAELKTKYRAVKPGESVAVIVDKDQTAAIAEASSSQPVKTSWWQGVWRWLGL